MDKEVESKVEEILSIALKEEGRAYFHNTSLSRDYHHLKEVNSMLLMFGKIHGPLTNGAWTYFEISLPGMEFMEDGGFEGRRKRKDYKVEMERLTLENARLQKKQMEYEKEIRYQERIIRIHRFFEAVTGIAVLLVCLVARLLKLQ